MDVEFADGDLDRLETDPSYGKGYPQAVVKIYRRRLQFIRSALDESDFYGLKSLHFEKLKGARQHQNSMRLNDEFRLILEIVDRDHQRVVLIVSIEDYH